MLSCGEGPQVYVGDTEVQRRNCNLHRVFQQSWRLSRTSRCSLNLSDFIKPPTGLGCLRSGPSPEPGTIASVQPPPEERALQLLLDCVQPGARPPPAALDGEITERARRKPRCLAVGGGEVGKQDSRGSLCRLWLMDEVMG